MATDKVGEGDVKLELGLIVFIVINKVQSKVQAQKMIRSSKVWRYLLVRFPRRGLELTFWMQLLGIDS